MNKIKFYVRKDTVLPSSIKDKEFFFLDTITWDDFGSKTSFNLFYYRNEESNTIRNNIGRIKIMHRDNPKTIDIIKKSFTSLEASFCSLGQDLVFYSNVKDIFKSRSRDILTSLNDAAISTDIRESFENDNAFILSLAREIEAKRSIEYAARVISGIPFDSSYEFSYSTQLQNADDNHLVKFNFDEKSKLPGRVVAIVGKNGTGKTQFLANLALDLSTQVSKNQLRLAFEPFKPEFSRVIAISYSAFDKFPRPSKTRNYSYFYFGLKEEDGLISQPKLYEIYNDNLSKIKQLRREEVWESILTSILPESYSKRITSHFSNSVKEKTDHQIANSDADSFLSSGYRIIIYMLTGVIANIQEQSLIIFDEPEMHLHPNAIAKLIKAIYTLLREYKSFAIIATHSPLVIQEVPSKHVYVFERDGNIPIVRKLRAESFGEDINTITEDIFNTIAVKEHYKDILDRLRNNMSYDSVIDLFENGLSMNAKIYLAGLYSE